jgi:hypothetical protein
MALANYTDLQATALTWMTRSGFTGDVTAAPDWVTLAEARLNRELEPLETDASLTGAVSSNTLDISAISPAMVEPVALFIAPVGTGDEVMLQPQAADTLALLSTNFVPRQWAINSPTQIILDTPCDQAYRFRFRYVSRFALASTTTNWLLTNHPDIYLAAVLMWGAGYNEEFQNGQVWKALLDEGVQSVRSTINQQHRGTLRVDPMLSRIGRRWYYTYGQIVNGQF